MEYENISIWLPTALRLRSQFPLSNIWTGVTFASVLPPWLKEKTEEESEIETETEQSEERKMVRRTIEIPRGRKRKTEIV